MSQKSNTRAELEQARDAVNEAAGNKTEAARVLGIPTSTLRKRYALAKLLPDPKQEHSPDPIVKGQVHAAVKENWKLPPKGKIKRYIFTCAQNNTKLHDAVWENIQALAAHYDAEIVVSTFTYNLAAYGEGSVKRGKAKQQRKVWYDPRIEPFAVDRAVQLAKGLIWCGEMNILPTAVRPLSGLEAYTGRRSGIFPHVKFAAETVASGKFEGTKWNFTTGTITQRNYIAKKQGLRAEFHHGYGGLLVEIDHKGSWWVRQLNADSNGTINDLTLRAQAGKVTDGHRVEAITWGDIHVGTIEREVFNAKWGSFGKSMIDVLQPKYQFMHDVLDFRSRNHHDMRDPHKMFEKYVEAKDNVVAELDDVAHFLNKQSYRDFCITIIVDSNHDNALTRWLREADYRLDPANAMFFLRAQLAKYSAIAAMDKRFHLLEWAIADLLRNEIRSQVAWFQFLRPDESCLICPDANGGIECGMHGDYGPNSSKGNLLSFARMGRKSNTGHSHSPAILDGAYRAGVTGSLDQGYNKGPSSWSCTDIVTYENGKRALVTTWKGKWRAQ